VADSAVVCNVFSGEGGMKMEALELASWYCSSGVWKPLKVLLVYVAALDGFWCFTKVQVLLEDEARCSDETVV